jgi:acyl-CoA dehydrogenase-like protein
MENEIGYQLSPELIAVRENVRRIIKDEIIPAEARLDPDAAEIDEDDYWRIARKVQAAGMWCMGSPTRYGGGGLSLFEMCVLMEEMCQHRGDLYNPGAGVFGRTPPPVIWGGTEEQIQKYAARTLKDATYTFFAITEPSGGSDPAGAIQCRAVREGDHYVLNGQKIFISHAHEAEWGVVFARTDPSAGRGGITAFIVEKGTPGFSAKPFKTLRTAALPNVVHFEDCRIPIAQRLGPEAGGLSLCMDLLTGCASRIPPAMSVSRSPLCGWRLTIPSSARLSARCSRAVRRSNGCWRIPRSKFAPRDGLSGTARGSQAARRTREWKPRPQNCTRAKSLSAWSIVPCRFMAAMASARSSRSSDGIANRASGASARAPRKSIGWSSRVTSCADAVPPPTFRKVSICRKLSIC